MDISEKMSKFSEYFIDQCNSKISKDMPLLMILSDLIKRLIMSAADGGRKAEFFACSNRNVLIWTKGVYTGFYKGPNNRSYFSWAYFVRLHKGTYM